MSEAKEIKAIECRFAKHVSMRKYQEEDVHLVKERIHYTDGTSAPNLRLVKGFKRPFWITQQRHRNHKQKKEYELEERLDKFECTQDDMVRQIAMRVGSGRGYQSYRDLAASPYLYGADIPSSSIIKKKYREKWPDIVTNYTVAMLDIETTGLTLDDIVLMVVVTDGKWLQLSVNAAFYDIIVNKKRDRNTDIAYPVETNYRAKLDAEFAIIQKRIEAAFVKYLGDTIQERGMTIDIVMCDDEVDTIQSAFNRLHKEKPDLVGIWNMNFDIPHIMGRLDKLGVNPSNILPDPSIPAKYRVCEYKPGKETKVSEKGISKSISMEQRWHVLKLSASFEVIDQMCLYYQIRIGRQKEPNYKLDTIMDKMVQLRKLTFKEAEHMEGPKWHGYMQKYHKDEYCVYCGQDGIGPIVLDEKTGDMRRTMPARARDSDFSHFDSQAHKTLVRLLTVYGKKGCIPGTLGPRETRQPANVLSRDGFIVTLKANLITEEGLQILEDNPEHHTGLYGATGDDDCIGSYPSDIMGCNIECATTSRELVDISGMCVDTMRHNNMNISSGPVNAIEYCVTMFNFPDYDDMMAEIEKLL